MASGSELRIRSEDHNREGISMKKAQSQMAICLLLLASALFIGTLPAFAQKADKNIHGFVIQVRSNKHEMNAIQQRYVSAEDLGPFFGVNIKSVDDGKAALIGHLHYDKSVKAYKGKAYVEAATFFNFFDIGYEKINDWTYRLALTNIPMFNSILQRFDPKGSMRVQGLRVDTPVLTIRDKKYVALDKLTDALKLPAVTEMSGKVILSGKPVEHWVYNGGKIFVNVKDAASATGKSVD
jgi:hypothetical protein